MAIARFSISMPAEVRDRIREHAAEAGLDVSTFLTVAAQAQMDQQDRVREIFEPFHKARTEAEKQAGTGVWAGDDIEPTEAEQAEVDAILGRTPRSETAA
jgi:S-methylmethionine-dependent homocysteine/selenocysteine methylase